MKGICLNMIVKNESKNMTRLFDSLHQYIDYFIISDTGSSDGTIKKIEEMSTLYNLKGKVVHHDWVDFAHNRNMALQSAIQTRNDGLHQCSWLMIIDADEELRVNNKKWVNELKEGYSYTTYKKLGGLSFKHIFLLWIEAQDWIWKGKVHNFIENYNRDHQKLHTNDLFIYCHQSEGAKSHGFKGSIDKGQFDIELLLAELGSDQINSDNVHRYFQLAYSYRDIKELNKAILYFKLVSDFEKASVSFRYLASVFVAKYALVLKQSDEDIQKYLQRAIELDSSRKEAYYYLAVYKRKISDFFGALYILEKADTMSFSNPEHGIIEEDIYKWKIKYELSFIYYQLNYLSKSTDVIQQLYKEGYVPMPEKLFLDSLQVKISTLEKGC